jgi:hypothetical protein
MVGLLAHPLLPLWRHTGRLRMRDNLLKREEGGIGVGEEPNHAKIRKPDPLYINHSTLSVHSVVWFDLVFPTRHKI